MHNNGSAITQEHYTNPSSVQCTLGVCQSCWWQRFLICLPANFMEQQYWIQNFGYSSLVISGNLECRKVSYSVYVSFSGWCENVLHQINCIRFRQGCHCILNEKQHFVLKLLFIKNATLQLICSLFSCAYHWLLLAIARLTIHPYKWSEQFKFTRAFPFEIEICRTHPSWQ